MNVPATYIAQMFNTSLASGTVPHVFKEACVTPLMLKQELDEEAAPAMD